MDARDMLPPNPLVGEPITWSASPAPWAGTQQKATALVHAVVILLVKIENLPRGKGGSLDGAPIHFALERAEVHFDELAGGCQLRVEREREGNGDQGGDILKVGLEHRRLVIAVSFPFPRAVPQPIIALVGVLVERMILKRLVITIQRRRRHV